MYYVLIAALLPYPHYFYVYIYINLMGKIALIISYAYCKNSIWSELYLTEIDHKLKKTAAYRRASLYGLNREFYSHNLPPPQIPPNVEIINYINALQVGIIKCLYLIIKFKKSREDIRYGNGVVPILCRGETTLSNSGTYWRRQRSFFFN